MKVKFLNSSDPYADYYSELLHFSFLSPKNEQAQALTPCKAYLQDAMLGFLNKKEMTAYNPETNPPLDLDYTRILLVHFKTGKEAFMKRMDNLMDFLHQVEKSLWVKDYEKSRFEIVENYPTKASEKTPIVVLIGDKRWQVSPPMISLYSLFARTCLSHKAGDKWHDTIKGIAEEKIKVDYQSDVTYMKTSLELINKIVLVGARPFFYKKIERNYPPEATSNLIHSAGVMAMAEKETRAYCVRWTAPRTNRIAARYCRRYKPDVFKNHYPEGVPLKKIKDEKGKLKKAKKKILV